MAIKLEEWIQTEWTQPGVDLFHEHGDFFNLQGLWPDRARKALKRAPGFSAHLPYAGLTNVRGMFYDENSNRYVIIGTNVGGNLASTYFSSAWSVSSIYELTSDTATLGGRSGRNLAWFGGNLYVIASDTSIYRGSSYTTSLSQFYATTDAQVLAAFGGRLYMATTTGKIYRLNDADDAFETHFDPVADYTPLFLTAFRNSLIVIGHQDDGTIFVYRLPQSPSGSNPSILAEAAHIPSATVDYHTFGNLFAVHDDKIYFSPGRYTNADTTLTVDLYTWNGSQLQRIAQIPDSPGSPRANGLINWRGELLYYNPISASTQTFKMLVGDEFVDFAPATIDNTSFTPAMAGLAGEIVATGKDESSNQGLHHAGAATLQDGYVVTSRLDMGHPSREKRLLRITALLNGAAADFKINIKYRVDDATSWTTAESALNNTYRAIADDLSVSFYTLQLRVELDDDTGNDEDIHIIALSALYSIGDN